MLRGSADVGEGRQQGPVLLLAGHGDREQPGHERVARGALVPKPALAPQHGRPNGLLRRVIRRLHRGEAQERPQGQLELEQSLRQADGSVMPRVLPAFQQHPELSWTGASRMGMPLAWLSMLRT